MWNLSILCFACTQVQMKRLGLVTLYHCFSLHLPWTEHQTDAKWSPVFHGSLRCITQSAPSATDELYRSPWLFHLIPSIAKGRTWNAGKLRAEWLWWYAGGLLVVAESSWFGWHIQWTDTLHSHMFCLCSSYWKHFNRFKTSCLIPSLCCLLGCSADPCISLCLNSTHVPCEGRSWNPSGFELKSI